MPTRKLVDINLLDGAKVKHLTLPDMNLLVTVEIDAELQKLIDKGQEGLRWQNLVDVAEKYTKPAKKIVKEEIQKFDAEVATLDEKTREKKLAEIKSVLKQVAAGQESGVNSAVEKEWHTAMRRSETLSKFKMKCTVKAIVGALALSASLASMIASGGASLISLMGAFKAATELAILIGDIGQSVSDAKDELDVVLVELRLNVDKDAASRTSQVVSDLSSIIGKFMSTIKTADQNQFKLEAKIGALEKNADELVGSLNAGLDKLGKIKTVEVKKKEFIKELADKNEKLIAQIKNLSKELKPIIQYNEDARQEIAEWKNQRKPKTVAAIRTATFLKAVGGLVTAARVFAKIAGAPIP